MLQLLIGFCYLLQFMLKCAMARLPNQPYLLTLYSNFIIEVRCVLCMICRGVKVSSVCPADRWVLVLLFLLLCQWCLLIWLVASS
jgi:hypothetical protein